MTNCEFAKIVATMLECEKETFSDLLKNEDWEGIRDEAYEYATQSLE